MGKEMVTIRISREDAMHYGLLTCKCGHPMNNHFAWGVKNEIKPCAHCDCKEYREKSRSGRIINGPTSLA